MKNLETIVESSRIEFWFVGKFSETRTRWGNQEVDF